ncbi:MAG: acyl-CoA thioesterase [Myxococcota bacterium]
MRSKRLGKAPEARAARLSRVEMTEVVLPGDTNPYGSAFGGRLMQWMDIAGAVAAHRHARGNVVTASVDDVHFVAPVRLGDIVVLRASVNRAWGSSMEVGVKIVAENPDARYTTRHTSTAYLTFVAIDARGHPRRVPAVVAKSADEKRRFAKAEGRRVRRLRLRRERLARLERA